MEIRPRTTGEILDDAWRMALADLPLLLLFLALFAIPAFVALLFLLAASPPSGIAQLSLPTATASLLALTGLASGACQELFRRRMADEPVTARICLTAALRHGLEHTAARTSAMCGLLIVLLLLLISGGGLRLLVLLVLLMPSLALWVCLTSLHVLIAEGHGRSPRLFRELGREVASAPGKSAAVVFSRLPLLLLTAVQLHLLGVALLWIADNLAGLDTALLSAELSFGSNPVYTTALFLLSWLLLAPYFEASNFLLHSDVRTRQEGLDLQYRVQRVFAGDRTIQPSRERKRAVLPLITALLLIAQPANAAETQLDAVRAARIELESIRAEVKKTEPYPGGQRWEGRLRKLDTRLARSGDGDARRFRWFAQGIAGFAARKREDALFVLDDLHRRLSLLEDSWSAPRHDPAASGEGGRRSPKDIKALLRGGERKANSAPAQEKIKEKEQPQREEVRRDEPGTEERRARGGGGPRIRVSTGSGGGGFSLLGWLLLAGLALAVLAAGLYLYLSSPRRPRSPQPKTATGSDATIAESEAERVLTESPDEWYRRAQQLAEQGQFREAVRVLYLAVLSLLHRRQFIRFEPTRTNGEYVRQVRLSEQAPPELHAPFRALTERFESNWYGERPCESDDYRAGRKLMEEIQQLARSP